MIHNLDWESIILESGIPEHSIDFYPVDRIPGPKIDLISASILDHACSLEIYNYPDEPTVIWYRSWLNVEPDNYVSSFDLAGPQSIQRLQDCVLFDYYLARYIPEMRGWSQPTRDIVQIATLLLACGLFLPRLTFRTLKDRWWKR